MSVLCAQQHSDHHHLFLVWVLRGLRRKLTHVGSVACLLADLSPWRWTHLLEADSPLHFQSPARLRDPSQARGARRRLLGGFHRSKPARGPFPHGVGTRGLPRAKCAHRPRTTEDHVCELGKVEFNGKGNRVARCAQGHKTQQFPAALPSRVRYPSRFSETRARVPQLLLVRPLTALSWASSLKSKKIRRENLSC